MRAKAVIIGLVFVAAANAVGGIEGAWEGELDFGPVKHRLIFHISRGADDGYVSTMDSPGENVKGLKVYKTSFDKGVLTLEIKRSGNFYKGKASDNGLRFEGKMKTSRGYMPLTLKPVSSDVMMRPQDPAEPFPYVQEEVVFENAKAGVRLAGTLTKPGGVGKFPAVVLISGSGPHDRNSEMMGHRPFLVLADYLTRKGIAVLRFDDRGIGSSTGDFSKATTEDFVGDVLAAVEYLKGHGWVDAEKIGLVGHSEGSTVAAIAAGRSNDVAYIVMMAGIGVGGDETLIEQTIASAKAAGVGGYMIEGNITLQRKIFSILKTGAGAQERQKQLRETYMGRVKAMGSLSGEQLKGAKAQIDEQIKQVTSPWFLYFVNYNPKPDLMKVTCPVLVLYGEKDLQVPPGVHEAPVREAFEAGGNRKYKIKVLKGLNHLFQTAQTGLNSEYSKIPETMSPSALRLIGQWVLQWCQEKR